MKNISKILLFTIIGVFLYNNNYAYKWTGPIKKGQSQNKQTKAEGCLAASNFKYLQVNDVKARINTGGDMWWDLAGEPQYFIPGNTKKTSMFSAALWIGGLDVNGQLKLAAQRYRQVGLDFWTGPIKTDGTASVEADVCTAFDKHWFIIKDSVASFLAAYKENPSLSGYTIPECIKNYPAHSSSVLGTSELETYYPRYLAPFACAGPDDDGNYDPYSGDYPYYDFENKLCPKYLPFGTPREKTREGNGILVDQILKGDQTLWWVFNDKGNVHTETQGSPIGMEIRAQAFGFATSDEVNRMTFYTYEIINRSTYELTETYMSQWVDTDLGYGYDDYVGCDVLRGLGYCYNGYEIDGTGQAYAYGAQPPAIGVDFFQGPYMDPDGIDDPKYDANGKLICGPGINGVNFGNGIVDDERFGMRRFVYHNNNGDVPACNDPDIAPGYYNLLRGIWGDNSHLLWGGNGHFQNGGTLPEADFMFPCTNTGNTDPCNWGTGELIPPSTDWTEKNVGNLPWDRRFMQSAGPFTLKPGACNYITVGIPWARATSGGAWASVELLRQVDDKCQTMFDNCFKVLDGPDAPELVIQELNNELILFVKNRKGVSNNYKVYPDDYVERDPNIVYPDSVKPADRGDSCYRFEGYQIFQCKDASVGIGDIDDPDKVRLVAQCDIKNFDPETGNPIAKLVNFYLDESLGGNVPVLEVDGANEGVTHSFRVLEDKFATSNTKLVNFKKYYYIAIAYSYNQFKKYDPNDPTRLDGQKKPYLSGRKGATGSIKSVVAIPHNPASESGGTLLQSQYGVQPKITRLEGQGNGGLEIDITQETHDRIMSSSNYKTGVLEYNYNRGPVNIKVVDPLKVISANYNLKFIPKNGLIDSASWILTNIDNGEAWSSQVSVAVQNEQLIPEIGLSLMIKQVLSPGDSAGVNNGVIGASITFSDSTNQWLSGIPNVNQSPTMALNWIRSGMFADKSNAERNDYDLFYNSQGSIAGKPIDRNEDYEKLLSGTIAPYRLSSKYANGPAINNTIAMNWNKLSNLSSVDLYITKDESKWTRCPVIEMCDDKILSEGGVAKFALRSHASVGKDGQPDGTGNGMGWFPGYAINVETGERLNMMFGENSWLIGENGRDMLWNPTGNVFTNLGNILFGGEHWFYILGHNDDRVISGKLVDCPSYDEGAWSYYMLSNPDAANTRYFFKDIMWTSCPLTPASFQYRQQDIPCDVKIRLRVSKPYKRYWSTNTGPTTPENDNWPMYSFNTNGISTLTNNATVAKGALELINIVPNPYYAFSNYETSVLDNRVRVTNLPEKCTVTIYNINGDLVRQLTKDDASTYIDWDLKNFAAIPISGGMYLIHINADGIGEKVLKWFAAMRPIDLNSF